MTAFALYCKEPFTVEQVAVHYPASHPRPSFAFAATVNEDGSWTDITPCLEGRVVRVPIESFTAFIGVALSAEGVVAYLRQMGLGATVDGGDICADVPAYRTDVLHAVDVIEDCAVAYGYERIAAQAEAPPVTTIGIPLRLSTASKLVRGALATSGCVEALTFSLTSIDEAFRMLNLREDAEDRVVCVAATPLLGGGGWGRVNVGVGIGSSCESCDEGVSDVSNSVVTWTLADFVSFTAFASAAEGV